MSTWFHTTATKGAHIELSQPFGRFLIEPASQPTLLVAGRAGIAPFLSAVRNYDEGMPPNLKLLYSARGSDDFCYPELLRAVDATFFDTASDQRITRETLSAYLQPSPHVYICGSKRFVDAITGVLTENGIDASHIHRELFTLQ